MDYERGVKQKKKRKKPHEEVGNLLCTKIVLSQLIFTITL